MLDAAAMEPDLVASLDIGGGAGEGIALLVVGSELESARSAEDAAFESVVGVIDLNENDGADDDHSHAGDGRADLGSAGAYSVLARVAAPESAPQQMRVDRAISRAVPVRLRIVRPRT